MDHLEMVEKLREKANVSYEEANDALEACDWDLLDALLMLESEGRLHEIEDAAYSTREESAQPEKEAPKRKHRDKGLIATLLQALGGLIKKGNEVSIQISKNGEVKIALPLTAVVIALIFMFWWMLIAAAVSMVFGYRYSVKGLSIDESINSAMDKAGAFVDNAVKPCEVKIVVDADKDEDKDAEAKEE